MKATRIITKKCPTCGDEFKTIVPNARYCGKCRKPRI